MVDLILEELGEGFALIDYEYIKDLLFTNRLSVRTDRGRMFRIVSSRVPLGTDVIWDISGELKKKLKIPLIVAKEELPGWVLAKTHGDFLVLTDIDSCYFTNRYSIEAERKDPGYIDENWDFPDNNYVLLIRLKYLVLACDILESIIVRKDGC